TRAGLTGTRPSAGGLVLVGGHGDAHACRLRGCRRAAAGARRQMRLAIVGTRGVPASYSGFETCVESVGKRLAARGHAVTVYCRPGRTGQASKTYLGMRRITLPDIPTKGLETLSHSLLSTIHATTVLRPDADRQSVV